jgi:cation transport ATPase
MRSTCRRFGRRGGARREGKTPLYFGNAGAHRSIAAADPARPTAAAAVAALRALEVEPVLPHRRQPPHRRSRSQTAGIARVIAEVLPADKARIIQQLHRTALA